MDNDTQAVSDEDIIAQSRNIDDNDNGEQQNSSVNNEGSDSTARISFSPSLLGVHSTSIPTIILESDSVYSQSPEQENAPTLQRPPSELFLQLPGPTTTETDSSWTSLTLKVPSEETQVRRNLELASMDVELLRMRMLHNFKRFQASNENINRDVSDGDIDTERTDDIMQLNRFEPNSKSLHITISNSSSRSSIFGDDTGLSYDTDSEDDDSQSTTREDTDADTDISSVHPSAPSTVTPIIPNLQSANEVLEKDEKRLKKGRERSTYRFINFLQQLKDPESMLSTISHCIIILIFAYHVTGVPFRICYTFFLGESRLASIILATVDIILDIWCILDVALNFLTPYTAKDGQLAYNPMYTSLHYLLSSNFWIDALSTFPLDWFVMIPLPRYALLFRLNRLIKLLRTKYYFVALERVSNLSSAEIRAIEAILTLAYMVHLSACLVHLVISLEEEDVGIAYTQVEEFFEYGTFNRYLYALSWSMGSLSGFGGTQAITALQLCFSTLVTFVGFSLFVLVVGTVGSIVSDISSKDSNLKLKIDTVDQYLRYRGAPSDLRQKIRDYYMFLHRARKGWDEEEIMGDLPPYLRMEVALDMNRKIIEKVPLFQAALDNRMFISSLVMSLIPRVMLPNTLIVKQGDVAQEMFFIASGTVEIILEDGTVVASLQSGSFFGEIALLHNTRRTASVRASTHVDLFILTKDSFERIVEDFPEAIEAIKREADSRVQRIQKSSTSSMSTKVSNQGDDNEVEEENSKSL